MGTLQRLGHSIAGLVASLVSFVNPALSIILALLFIIYELDEEWRIRDTAYIDILDFSIGAYLGAVIMLISHVAK